MKKDKIICFDIETTGLDPFRDEILQLSIVDGHGNVLFDEFVKPENHTEWAEAAAINGITPEMTADKQPFTHWLPTVQKIFDSADLIVGYNCDGFDLAFMEQAGLTIDKPTFDVMLEFAPIYGDYDERHGDYRWQKLAACATYYGYKGQNWHNSLDDTIATLHCYYGVLSDLQWTVTEDEVLEPITEPFVTILWSESNKLRDGEIMSLYRANARFKSLDEENKDLSRCYKTQFRIDFTFDGKRESYTGRQDFGDGDGSLIDHIEQHTAYYLHDEPWQKWLLLNKGREALDADISRRELLLNKVVPYFKLHCSLSEIEQTAKTALWNSERLTPTDTAYYTALTEYAAECRAMLNSGNYKLPDAPKRPEFVSRQPEPPKEKKGSVRL